MFKKISMMFFAFCLIMITLTACQTAVQERYYKDRESESSGGLWRSLIIYNVNEEIVEQLWGQFDVENSSIGNQVKIKIDVNKVRYIYILSSTDRTVNTERTEDEVRQYWKDNNITPHVYNSLTTINGLIPEAGAIDE